jgi:hypothetical protein
MSKISSATLINSNTISNKVRQVTPSSKSESRKTLRSPSPSRKPLSANNKSPANSTSKVTLKDLCPEDKEKIGQLMNKLAVEKTQREEIEKKATEERSQLEKKLKKLKKEKLKLLEESEKLKSQFEKSLDLLKTYKTKSIAEVYPERFSALINTAPNTSRNALKPDTDTVGIPPRPEVQKDYYTLPLKSPSFAMQTSIDYKAGERPTVPSLNIEEMSYSKVMQTTKKNSEAVQVNLDELTQSQFVKDYMGSNSLSEASYSNREDVQVRTTREEIKHTFKEDIQTRESSVPPAREFKINELFLHHDFSSNPGEQKRNTSRQNSIAFTDKAESMNKSLCISSTQVVTVALPEEHSEIFMPSRDMSPTPPLDKSQRPRAIHEIKNLKNDIAVLTKSLRHLNTSLSPSVRSSQYKESVLPSKNVSPILAREPSQNIPTQWLDKNVKGTILFQSNYKNPLLMDSIACKEEDSKVKALLDRVAANHSRLEFLQNKSIPQTSIPETPHLIPAPFKFTSPLTFNPNTSVEESPATFMYRDTPRVNFKSQEEELPVIDDCFYDDALFNLVDELEGMDLPSRPVSEAPFNSKMISVIDDLEYQGDLEYSPPSNLQIDEDESDSSFERLRRRNYEIRQSLGRVRRL